ncbi:MAG TPA: glycosyltransferase [Limnobacter sp.]|uniref:MraY family glycosyltransferase n=1 Tax=Limnobacter sp. TaxID=2003368 RepID=UPI002E33DBB4|nr:glycosyltransferase [Limnobacter sp.]HEX5486008.1 glycosyltransferase [Limnobacter sp.]
MFTHTESSWVGFGSLVVGFLVSWATCLLIVRTQHWHGRFTLDGQHGKQKVHTLPTPRIGGLALALGLLAAVLWARWNAFKPADVEFQHLLGSLCLSASPAFVVGFIEDITKSVSVKARLIATAASGIMLVLFTGHWVTHVSVPGLDTLLLMYPVGMVFTAFAVAGIANSVNIIDGFNGLAGGVVVLMLLTIAAIAYRVDDATIFQMALLGAVVTFGFLLLNYPRGSLFLGDAGAYGLGFYVAALAVLLAERNIGEVSPWAMLLVCGYPFIETMFSIYRRLSRKKKGNPGQPDALHLHSLVYRRLISRHLLRGAPAWQRNAFTAPIMWVYAAVPMMGAITWPESFAMVAAWLAFSAVVYLRIYRKLLSFSLFTHKTTG